METLQGTHKYISLVVRNKIPSPKKSILINLFHEFTVEPIKDYVFHRINKTMLLEPALRILQEIAEKGAARTKSLQLVVEKTSNGSKSVVIARIPDTSEKELSFQTTKIDDVTFKVSDRAGLSPDISFSIGKNRDPAYQESDVNGYFTPKRGVRKSLNRIFQVRTTHHDANQSVSIQYQYFVL